MDVMVVIPLAIPPLKEILFRNRLYFQSCYKKAKHANSGCSHPKEFETTKMSSVQKCMSQYTVVKLSE